MAIKRYYAAKDNTISNMFLANLSDRGINGNTGQSDILEVFSIYGQASSSSLEQARILIEFPIDELSADRDNGIHPSTGVKFYLNLYNAPHSVTTPENYIIEASPVVQSWEEGYGLDMENWLDAGPSTWASCSLNFTGSSKVWTKQGGDTYSNYSHLLANVDPKTMFLSSSTTDLSIDVTDYVEEWIKYIKAPVKASIKLVFAAGNTPPTDGTTIKIRSSDTQEVTYRFKAGVIENPTNLDNTGNIEEDLSILVDTTGLPGGEAANQNMDDVIKRLANAIAHENGHNGKITTSFDLGNNTITLTQAVAGYGGNTKVTVDIPEGGTAITLKTAADDATTHFEDGQGRQNNGLLVKLSDSYEDGSRERSFYTKKFFARGSQFFFKRPVLEARWDSSIKDDRGNLTTANPALSNADNTNTLYYHNYVNGVLTDLPSLPKFALTPDKGLGEYATLLNTNDSNELTAEGQDVDPTTNAFADIEFGDFSHFIEIWSGTSEGTGWIGFSHTNPTTSEVETVWFAGLSYNWSLGKNLRDQVSRFTNEHPDSTFPVFVSGHAGAPTVTMQLQTIRLLIIRLNDNNIFNASFFAKLIGTKLRIYSKLPGSPGQNSSITMTRTIRRADSKIVGDSEMARYTPDFDASNEFDTLTVKDGSTKDGAARDFIKSTIEFESARGRAISGYGIFREMPIGLLEWKNTANDLGLQERKFRGNSTGQSGGQQITATKESTGVYKVSFKIGNNIEQDVLYEKWWLATGHGGVVLGENSSGLLRGHNGSMPVKVKNYYDEGGYDISVDKIVNVTNLKSSYSQGEKVKLNVFIRNKIENQNVYSKMMGTVTPVIMDNAHYQIKRITDDLVVVPFSTGSAISYTGLGYNEQGCNFTLDTSYLEKNYAYELSFCCIKGLQKFVLDDKFKFRVD